MTLTTTIHQAIISYPKVQTPSFQIIIFISASKPRTLDGSEDADFYGLERNLNQRACSHRRSVCTTPSRRREKRGSGCQERLTGAGAHAQLRAPCSSNTSPIQNRASRYLPRRFLHGSSSTILPGDPRCLPGPPSCSSWDIAMVLEDDLSTAAATGRPGDVERLLREGADVNGLNRFGRRALQVMMMGSEAVARLLLSHGADPNVADRSTGSTPLHDAARTGHVGTVRLLVEHRADPQARDNKQRRAVDLAEEYGNRDVVAFLEDL
ncbi:poly [ADP-ribose] polymerase tankyrase-2 [Limanda limanda]|uniref:poly [ADP-ribose] polymerase tankyrase-2 n=1 Tax=Limanda limanda TaxID=27771 RepID=UPI0029C65501|nr:poly [ADP-ribose] polymerase tankyrase-2 [Limanda limanda]